MTQFAKLKFLRSQMRLYELYALSLPLFVCSPQQLLGLDSSERLHRESVRPTRRQLPSYIYRGLTTIEAAACGKPMNHNIPQPNMNINVFTLGTLHLIVMKIDLRYIDIIWTYYLYFVLFHHSLSTCDLDLSNVRQTVAATGCCRGRQRGF